MLNIKVPNSERIRNKINIIKSITNAKGQINISSDIKEEFLDTLLVQVELLNKFSNTAYEFKWFGNKLGFKREKDTNFSFMDLKGIDGKDGKNGKDGNNGKDGLDGKNGLDGRDGKDGLNGINGKDGLDGKDGKEGKDGKDGLDGESIEFDILPGKIGIKYKKDRDFKYINVLGSNGLRGAPGIPGAPGKDGGVIESFESVAKNLFASDGSFVYSDGNLIRIDYTSGIIKTFNYTGNDLTSIVLSGDTPEGIDLTKTFSYSNGNLTGITYS